MSEIVNLNRARKTRARAEAKVNAAENRVRFGRSKGEKVGAGHEREKAAKVVDGAKLVGARHGLAEVADAPCLAGHGFWEVADAPSVGFAAPSPVKDGGGGDGGGRDGGG